MGYRIINIFDSEKLSLNLNNLIIKSKDFEYSVLINDIDVLLINDFKTVITTRVLNKLIDSNVCVITCDEKYEPVALALPISGHCTILKVAEAQTKWTVEQKAFYWQYIVKYKIQNQVDVLKMKTDESDAWNKLFELADNVELDDATNREGHAAKVYFHTLYGRKFKRFNEDGRNFALNYGYTILRGTIVRTICAKGLIPFLSIKHKSASNYFALADDLIEPFRPIVDLYVKQYVDEDVMYLSKQHRTNLVKLLNQKVLWNKQEITLNRAIEKMIDEMIDYFDTGEIPDNYPQILPLSVEFEYEY